MDGKWRDFNSPSNQRLTTLQPFLQLTTPEPYPHSKGMLAQGTSHQFLNRDSEMEFTVHVVYQPSSNNKHHSNSLTLLIPFTRLRARSRWVIAQTRRLNTLSKWFINCLFIESTIGVCSALSRWLTALQQAPQ